MEAVQPDANTADATRRERRFDRVAVAYGIGWFAFVMLAAFALWAVDFQVSVQVQSALFYGGAAGLLLLILRGTPSSSLTPDLVARRDARRTAGLIGASLALLLLGGYIAALQLTSWAEWVVLGGMITGTIGVGITLHSHLMFRRR